MALNSETGHNVCLGKNVDDNEVFNFNKVNIKNSEEINIQVLKQI